MKISVIIPVFNSEEYLKACLDSVLLQSIQEIEILCVDDGSTDDSLFILQKYALKDKRIKILKQKNMGSGIARNNALRLAKGEFVAFLDSDDFYPNTNTLENMYHAAIKHDMKISGGSLIQLRNDEYVYDVGSFEQGYIFTNNGIVEYKDYQYDYGYWRFIYNRKFLIENNIYFPNYLRMQDPPFFIKAMIYARKFYALKEPTYIYRVVHKKISWNERKATDVVKGFIDCLQLSSGYSKLQERLVRRITSNHLSNIFLLHIKKENHFVLASMLKLLNSEICKKDYNLQNLYKLLYCCNISTHNNQVLLGATDHIKNQLCYKLGNQIVKSTSLVKIFLLPYRLLLILINHKIEKKILKIMSKKDPKYKTLSLNSYTDHMVALEVKNHLSYKIGQVLIRDCKNWYKGGIFKLPYSMYKAYKDYKGRKK
ncbi:glycosyltransferase [Campylobacter lari]|uniref:Glycosyltransferase n=2 Tax=Campylobacter lari TaxID=201 RepID=A0A698FUW1_CAMLA|nr:glycosyltransferase [Campylobacter lari]